MLNQTVKKESPFERIKEMVLQYRQQSDQPVCAYVYDLDWMKHHVREVMRLLPERCQMFYAMKANSERPILVEMSKWVDGFEVASIGEVRKARKVHPTIPIVFGGPGKTNHELEEAIHLGVQRFHVESLHELYRLEWIASHLQQQVEILLRVNLAGPFPDATLHMAGRPTQFGIQETEVLHVLHVLKKCSHLKCQGFHFHSISNNLDAERHLQLISLYIEKAKAWSELCDLPISLINVGGGIGINYQNLDCSFQWASFTEQLAQVIEEELPTTWNLMFECGRFLTAGCGAYVTEVIDVKKNHGQYYVIVRGGTHHFRLPASWQHSHPFAIIPIQEWTFPYPRPSLDEAEVQIVGQLCTPKDVMAKGLISSIRVGDLVLFQYTGAYGWSISHHDFLSHPHPEQIYLNGEENL